MNEELLDLLEKLRLKRMAGVFTEMLAKAQREGWGHHQLLDSYSTDSFGKNSGIGGNAVSNAG